MFVITKIKLHWTVELINLQIILELSAETPVEPSRAKLGHACMPIDVEGSSGDNTVKEFGIVWVSFSVFSQQKKIPHNNQLLS